MTSNPRTLTREQLQARKEKAVRFTRDILEDPERAAEIADEDLDDYAARRRIRFTNPTHRRKPTMAARRLSREEIEDRLVLLC